MFARNGFNKQKSQLPLGTLNPVPASALPNIHETPGQNIQGGADNDHFHLTEVERDAIYLKDELVMSVAEIVLDPNGNPVTVEVARNVA